MNKRIKIILYIILILAIIAVVRLMFGNTNPNVEITDTDEILAWEEIKEASEETTIQTPTFEEDVMKDLEGFFGDNNGYEDVQWEFWFTNPENE